MQLFYCPEIAIGQLWLSNEESKHAIKVLRKKKRDKIHIIDGTGGLYKVGIEVASHKKCSFKILETKLNFDKKPYYLHIAIAPTKNLNRLEWFVEKAVEIGIDEITLIICSNSERKELNLKKLQKIALSATKQSIKSTLPIINDAIHFKEVINRNFEGTKFIAHCENNNGIFLTHSSPVQNQRFLVLIGPEGDFSLNEITAASQNNFKKLSFGKNRLRTETAGMVTCSQISGMYL